MSDITFSTTEDRSEFKTRCKLYIMGYNLQCAREKMECTYDIGNSYCHEGYLKFDWVDYLKWGYKYAEK